MSASWTKVLVGLCLLAGVAAGSTQAKADDNYGAIAYSDSTGAIGWSYDYSSRRRAEDRAQDECADRGEGCKVVLWFRNACGAIATGRNHGFGTAWAETRGDAERAAMGYCRQYTSNCEVAAWACTTR